jgi:hypothetical protein
LSYCVLKIGARRVFWCSAGVDPIRALIRRTR